MGYKSLIRSGISYSNRILKENEIQQRQQIRMNERLQKKINNTNEKLGKIYLALDDEYAKGKIDKKLYEEFTSRKQDITVDLLALGKAPFVSLAKRYITGKISRNEYMDILKSIIPNDYFEEKEKIFHDLEKAKNNLKLFHDNCNITVENECQKCGKKKSIFSVLKIRDSLILCSKCIYNLETLKKYKGFNGNYFNVEPVKLELNENENKNKINISFNLDLL